MLNVEWFYFSFNNVSIIFFIKVFGFGCYLCVKKVINDGIEV